MEWLKVGSDIDGEAPGDQSGWSVSLSANGTRVAIGAIGNGSNTGHVRIYELTNGDWSQLGSDINGEAAGDGSGFSVSLSADGTRVAIGAVWNDPTINGATANDAGHVRIYELTSGDWVQMGSDIDGEAADDNLGYSVSLSADGTRVAIGARYSDNSGLNIYDSGHVRIYDYEVSSGTWLQVGQDIDGEAQEDQSAESVSLSADGTRVAIGAARNNGTGSNDAGHVRIYEFSTTTNTWVQLGSDIDGEAANVYSGSSVSLSEYGTTVAISASEKVAIYDYSGNDWSQVGADIYSSGTVSLSSDGLTVAIGALYQGKVQIYKFSSGTWSQVGQDIDGEAADDYSGWSVSLSADGTTVAIGAMSNDPTINGAIANDAGHVRIYELVSTTTTTTEAPTHQTILSVESVGTSTNEITGKINYVWQLKATTTSL